MINMAPTEQLDIRNDSGRTSTALRPRVSAELEPISTTQSSFGASLRLLLDQFLSYIRDYRRYSPNTVVAYRHDCERFIEFRKSGGLSLDPMEVTTREVRLFLASLQLNPNSVRRTLYALASFFGYLCDIEVIERNPAAGIQPPKRKRTLPAAPTRDECQKLQIGRAHV